jgi:hypothetical protein
MGEFPGTRHLEMNPPQMWKAHTLTSVGSCITFDLSAATKVDLLDRLHRHLTLVFSLRSFPKGGNVGDTEEELDIASISTFFLPAQADGKAYVQCYFEHVSSTPPRKLTRRPHRLIVTSSAETSRSCAITSTSTMDTCMTRMMSFSS